MRVRQFMNWMLFLSLAGVFLPLGNAAENPYFQIQVVDEETGRSVPLVELKTVNEICYYTDNHGIVAFHEPGLMDIDVFFFVSSHGYSYPADGFGMQGLRLHPEAGKSATIRIHRNNLAERLYRITGQGTWRDSVLTNRSVPIGEPVLQGQVLGQDSVLVAMYQKKLFWFWGDTNRPQYPLGNFRTSGATSELPSSGGLSPDQGIDLHYFVDEHGFCKSMAPIKKEGMIWLDGLLTIPDSSGRERLLAHYSHMKSLGEMLEHGLVIFDDEKQEFQTLCVFDRDKKLLCPRAHPIFVPEQGQNFFYFPAPYPTVRVRANFEDLQDPSLYESYTCLQDGTSYKGKDSLLDRKDSHLVYSWKKNTDPIGPREEKELVDAGLVQIDDVRYLPIDIETKKPVVIHYGSVNWNEFRKKWILIGVEIGGTSFLGEVWYSESDRLDDPWKYAQKIVTHNDYSFYNPVHHPFFDQENGKIVYFEGTYSKTFSGASIATPRYDYNQIMYRLDLSKLSMK